MRGALRKKRAPSGAERALDNLAAKALKAVGIQRKKGPETRMRPPEVFVLSDREMRRLKKRFWGREMSADVLAFPEPRFFPHPEMRGRALGEIYLNSRAVGAEPGRTKLLVHGLLHLLGYDHGRRGERAQMERLEARVLKAMARDPKR